jgi:hypothetical protein
VKPSEEQKKKDKPFYHQPEFKRKLSQRQINAMMLDDRLCYWMSGPFNILLTAEGYGEYTKVCALVPNSRDILPTKDQALSLSPLQKLSEEVLTDQLKAMVHPTIRPHRDNEAFQRLMAISEAQEEDEIYEGWVPAYRWIKSFLHKVSRAILG